MAIKVEVKRTVTKDGLQKYKVGAKALNNRAVHVGMPTGSEQAYIAAIHEWGVNIAVTEKMRRWFIAQGRPLKKSTTHIVIPERSFFRNGMDAEGEKVVDVHEKLVPYVIAGELDADAFLNNLGTDLAGAIKDYATELSSPPNSGFTIERKGSSNPLADTGTMIGAIAYKVK